MYIIITSATALESRRIFERKAEITGTHRLELHTSGVGIMASTYSLTKLLHQKKPDLIIQCGIAGSFLEEDDLGKVVIAQSDCISTGVEENGEWHDLFDNGFADANAFPFTGKKLVNPWMRQWNITRLPPAAALTVDEISTKKEKILLLKEKYRVDIESMEGAPFHFVCLQHNVPFLQMRAISNKTGERDKRRWRTNEALDNLADAVIDYLNKLCCKFVA